eukprot:TRINITY_DN996_c0_g5_i1.p1 TRINITY_DN996_c0_g5~~TRINITY_DN996_c0_g5_i1.p1  ORF type:complete len:440 (-),score=83.93 TRINITY_DN996_c0_g5_i1:266-1585(-)
MVQLDLIGISKAVDILERMLSNPAQSVRAMMLLSCLVNLCGHKFKSKEVMPKLEKLKTVIQKIPDSRAAYDVSYVLNNFKKLNLIGSESKPQIFSTQKTSPKPVEAKPKFVNNSSVKATSHGPKTDAPPFDNDGRACGISCIAFDPRFSELLVAYSNGIIRSYVNGEFFQELDCSAYEVHMPMSIDVNSLVGLFYISTENEEGKHSVLQYSRNAMGQWEFTAAKQFEGEIVSVRCIQCEELSGYCLVAQASRMYLFNAEEGDFDEMEPVYIYSGEHKSPIIAMETHMENSTFITATEDELKFWDANCETSQQTVPISQFVKSKISQIGWEDSKIIVATSSGEVLVFEVKENFTMKLLHQKSLQLKDKVPEFVGSISLHIKLNIGVLCTNEGMFSIEINSGKTGLISNAEDEVFDHLRFDRNESILFAHKNGYCHIFSFA